MLLLLLRSNPLLVRRWIQEARDALGPMWIEAPGKNVNMFVLGPF